MGIGKEIAAAAEKKNICEEWHTEMLNIKHIAPLCKMYFDGDDWAMQNDFPSLEMLKKHKGKSDKYGLHTDFEGELSNQHQTALFGKSVAKLNYDGYFAGKLNIRHNSKAEIKLSGNAFLLVNLLDDAYVEIEATENAKVTVYRYGENSNYKITGNVVVTESKWEK